MFKNLKKLQFIKNSGFGSLPQQANRLVDARGRINIRRKGQPFWLAHSSYHYLIDLHWAAFALLIGFIFVVINILFTEFYILIGIDQFAGLVYTSGVNLWVELFSFSAQTFTSVGYGRINPTGTTASIVSSFQALLGLSSIAILTGLVYGRFSKPRVKLLQSEHVLIAPFKEGKALMFRIVNSRNHQLLECEGTLMFSYIDPQQQVRKFVSMPLDIQRVTSIALGWTIVHPINEQSPLWEITPESELWDNKCEFVFMFKAYDETYSQAVHTRISYTANNLIWNAKFLSMYYRSEDGDHTIVDLSKLGSFTLLSE